MTRRAVAVTVIALTGLFASISSVTFYVLPRLYPASPSGFGWLGLSVGLLVGAGLVTLGVRTWLRGLDYATHSRIPAGTLIGIGALTAVGASGVLSPWQSYGGLWGFLLFFCSIGLLVLPGGYWWWTSQPRPALMVIAAYLGVEGLLLASSYGIADGVHPVAVFVIIGGLPVFVAKRSWPRLVAPDG